MKPLYSLLLALCLLGQTGCLLSAPSPAAKSAHTRSLETWYPDVGAQKLAVAAEFGDVAEVRRLMKEEGVNPDKHFSPEGMPLLAWPIFTQNPDGLKAMLENGADPNARYPIPFSRTYQGKPLGRYFRNNAMVWAAKQSNPIYLRHLLDHGGDPNTRNSNDESLVYQAYIWQNQWQNVQLLIERGANINEPIPGGILGPIIELYATTGAFQKVYWLLEHGADPGLDYYGGLADPPFSSHSASSTIEAIFWKPMKPGVGSQWQEKCQRWVLSKGFTRPPLPDDYREDREYFGYETDETKVPLPELTELAP
jgi:hypothetical protein